MAYFDPYRGPNVSLSGIKTLPTTSTVELASPCSPDAISLPLPPYVYTPLPDAGWIRVLELHPGTGPLSCSLSSCKLEEGPLRFEALSYVWGKHQDGINIECDGRTLSIGPNLACALERLRHGTQSRLLWVDAVCINQWDNNEKSHQVRQMGNVYGSAKRVLIWVGEDSRDEASQCLATIHNTITTLTDLASRYGGVEKMPPIALDSEIINSSPETWAMVRRLMESEWFERVWVLQEVGLARSALLLYGQASINWSYLVELMLFVALRADVGAVIGNVKSGMFWDVFEDIWRSFGNPVSWRNELPLTKSMNHPNSSSRFIDILNDGRQYKATNQRDRVYAFLGHPSVSSGSRNQAVALISDYDKSVDDVYFDAARYILQTDPFPWTILACVDHISNSPSLSGQRPSWVPRWDEEWRIYWLGYPEMFYRAGGLLPRKFQAEASASMLTLSLPGILLDEIVWYSQAFRDEDLKLPSQKDNAPLQAVWRGLEEFNHDSTVYGRGSEARELAYSLAIVAGRNTDDGPAHADLLLHQSIYQAYKNMISHETATTGIKPASNEDGGRNMERDVLTYMANQRRALHNRCIFLTSKGYYGIGHKTLQVGDICCVFEGANVPFVLRRLSRPSDTESEVGSPSNRYLLVGESYIQGTMEGEILEMADRGDLVRQNIVLV
ncbi:hypothetical protein LTR96_010633 [Exophiala xenobiotica]|uniref:Heterokaryon incompatibility domain-containing protein n=1 Tax=Vermiconidia calcicola TaxID=1690605 RepID=A0AAV9Q7S7_9PEZI|nr:hypothetical protein LTR96_010633 [Exophiala xenobiotica]KAK5536908.1 hypothetical protein LTR25_005583 [Vermiconidia calcicola]KAK5543053.1 hypothetical protein LTR23_005094 [Chaetothyriales sp. CCFEE 6169]KAK5340992.1 hypothetical protein LTR98_001784 [Exophiala xenobiotica]KAK5425526.1 hypothetical protein LTR34_011044 [Exophiala xenobiotica]